MNSANLCLDHFPAGTFFHRPSATRKDEVFDFLKVLDPTHPFLNGIESQFTWKDFAIPHIAQIGFELFANLGPFLHVQVQDCAAIAPDHSPVFAEFGSEFSKRAFAAATRTSQQ
jgi:hypothetical protein